MSKFSIIIANIFALVITIVSLLSSSLSSSSSSYHHHYHLYDTFFTIITDIVDCYLAKKEKNFASNISVHRKMRNYVELSF